MSVLHEKIFFGFITLAAAGISAAGATLTTGDTRWLFVTFASSFLMSGFLALMFKGTEETINLVIGRCGFAIVGGILATKPVGHYFGLTATIHDDAIALAGVASAVCIATFFVGFYLLRILERQAPAMAEKWFKKFDS
ncbi:MAG: hypothetical protein V4819_19125 [Verrucomicrobiota bacterium]